ncbi:hypothetical protein P691DRAFT_781941 [Macrolepiota fuliginosa MF-IS2]|uniref:Uncharacterized protein n=1 Tax=Macrolepiota fuliginosa MF-IS2 TaxID=1400762 RepID=A0A9P6BWI7_9AGAR|nr:hypothetical protein P691DRAFT_781941 [Macrolepiota fuliginosa MF-IS2]
MTSSFNSFGSRTTRGRHKESSPTQNTSRVVSVNSVQGPPAPVSATSTHLQTAVDDNQPANLGGTVPSIPAVPLQPPFSGNYSIMSNDDQTIDPRDIVPHLAESIGAEPTLQMAVIVEDWWVGMVRITDRIGDGWGWKT